MANIEKIVKIKAPPEDVFEIILKIEDFPKYSNLIKDVKETGEGIYRWVVKIGIVELKWDSTITESVKGKKVAWASIGGVKHSGLFILEPTEEGTKVTFHMEYLLPFMEYLVGYVSSYWLERISSDILRMVKEVLED